MSSTAVEEKEAPEHPAIENARRNTIAAGVGIGLAVGAMVAGLFVMAGGDSGSGPADRISNEGTTTTVETTLPTTAAPSTTVPTGAATPAAGSPTAAEPGSSTPEADPAEPSIEAQVADHEARISDLESTPPPADQPEPEVPPVAAVPDPPQTDPTPAPECETGYWGPDGFVCGPPPAGP